MSSHPDLFVSPRADALILGDRKIDAIKAVIEANPGISLRAAKDAVEAREHSLRAGAASAPAGSAQIGAAQIGAAPDDASGLPAAAREALAQGRVIDAIKAVREAHGVDLRTAKQRVDAHLRGEPGGAAAEAASTLSSASGSLPADVVSLLHAGDRGAAWQLLEAKYGATSAESLRRIADYEIARKRRGLGGGADATVVRGGDNGKRALWAVLAALAAVAVWWLLR